MTPENPAEPGAPEDAGPAKPSAEQVAAEAGSGNGKAAEARKTPPEPAAAPASPAKRPPPGPGPAPRGRGALFLAAAALVLALVAIAGVAGVGWAWYQMRGEQARITELEGRVAGLDGRIAALGQRAATAASVKRLEGRLQAVERSRRQDLQSMRGALDALASRVSGGSAAYREDEAAALMRLARARLQLAHDPEGAEAALKLADSALADVADPGLTPVRAALAKEIAAVQAVPRPDLEGAYLRLGALADGVDELPLAGDRTVAPPAATAPAPGWSWRGVGEAFKRAFSPLVVVRHGPAARPLLPPREAYFVRANLRLAIAGAQLALLERDGDAYRANLAQAGELLRQWFATDDSAVAATGQALSELAAVRPAPALPQLGAALDALQAARTEPATQ